MKIEDGSSRGKSIEQMINEMDGLFRDWPDSTPETSELLDVGTNWNITEFSRDGGKEYDIRHGLMSLRMQMEKEKSVLSWPAKIPDYLQPGMSPRMFVDNFLVTIFHTLPKAIYNQRSQMAEIMRRHKMGSTFIY